MASGLTAAHRQATTAPRKTAQTTFVTRTSTPPAPSLSPPAKLPVTLDIPPAAHPPPSSNSAPPSTLPASTRHSSYPRPSPPGFLYPHPIVPRAVQNQLHHAHAHAEMAPSNAIWPLAYVLVCAGVVIGLLLLTYAARASGAANKPRMEKRPVDKATKHAPGRGDTSAREGEVELKQRRQTQHQRPSTSAATAIRFDIPEPVDSPPNPFFRPASPTRYLSPARALQRRTEEEWLGQHAAFFGAASSSSEHAAYDQEYDVEALEAGTAPRSPGLKARKKSLSWADLDLGLDRMEGRVSGWVGKVARWTDDDGDEGVLLPVVNGRQGVKVE